MIRGKPYIQEDEAAIEQLFENEITCPTIALQQMMFSSAATDSRFLTFTYDKPRSDT
jgi:hypothetical protein